MSPEDLDKIEALAKEATPGPWGVRRQTYLGGLRYIAALSPDAALSLVAEVRRLRAECSGLHKARETESVRMRDLEKACDEMRVQRDESQGALRWILANVEHASGKFQGCASGQLLVDLARAVAKNATQMEASS